MAENKIYMALGEEATRGTKEATTVGFIPLLSPGIPKLEFDDQKRKEFRGDDAVKGDSAVTRMSRKWGGSLEMPFFTEAGTTAGMVGTILKHFFGTSTSAQNASTGQYYHMCYPVANPFSSSNLDTKALTLNLNINEGTTMKNWPYVGGRVSSLSFDQEAGSQLKVSADLFGQKKDTTTAEIGSPAFAAENLRCDFTNLTVYTGTITRTGTGPDYTDFTFGSATTIKPDKVSVKIENGMEDALRIAGVDYPDKTRMGLYKVTLTLTIDWEDPASGFSSIDEFNNWLASTGETNFFLHWDTGTQAGTGDNHSLYLDIPRANRTGGDPDYSLDKDPMITLNYEGLYDATTTKYIVGAMLKNTASAV
ncbi:MAG: phage tail tube protein [Thermodesulfobacteriota bacterium]